MYHVTGNEKKATFKIITTLDYTTPHFAILPHTNVEEDIIKCLSLFRQERQSSSGNTTATTATTTNTPSTASTTYATTNTTTTYTTIVPLDGDIEKLLSWWLKSNQV
jgi:hypothetical protein